MSKRFLIADDHPLIREGVCLSLRAAFPDFVVDTAEDVLGAEKLIDRHRSYRLIILDFLLPDAQGFSGLLRLQRAAGTTPIAILSATQSPELVAAARALGAAAYLDKAQPLSDTLASLRRIMAGESIFPSRGENASAASVIRARIADLSDAQLRVLLALADGRLNKQIAGELGVTEATIKAHMSAIFRKLGVINRTQAILAMQPLLGAQRENEL